MEGVLIRINETEIVRLKIFSDPAVDKQRFDRDKLFESLKSLFPLKLQQATKDRVRADLFRCGMFFSLLLASLQFSYFLEQNDERTFTNVKTKEGKYERLSVLPVNIVVCLVFLSPTKYLPPNSIFADMCSGVNADIIQVFKTGRRDISSLK
jgi:hypothetical protein